MKRQRRAFVAAITISVVALTGCSSTDARPEQNEQTVSSHTLRYLEPQTWTTLYAPSGGFYPNGGILNQITDRLLYQDPETLELTPWIAEDLPEVNSDATEYTFTLREGVTYSDGSPLDAENVVKNFELYGNGDSERGLPASEAINNYDHAEALDERTVRFFFNAPSPGFAQAVSTINSGLLSNETLDRTSDEFGPGNAASIIGSGPFVVAEERIGQQLDLVTREDYDWAPPARAHQGAAEIDGVSFILAAESSVRVGTVVAGQADIARQIPAPDESQFASEGLSIVAASTNGVNNGLNFRFGHPLLEDIRVRKALISAIDREQIISTLFSENYPIATGVLAKSALGYVDTSEHYRHDVAEAKALLDEAGWLPGNDGVREKDGQRLELTFNEALPQPRSKDVVTLVQEQLSNIGVAVNIFSGDQVAQDTAKQDIDAVQVYHSMVGRADFDVLKSQYHSLNRNSLLNVNKKTGELFDPQLEELLERIASVATAEERQEASAAAQHYLAEHAYVLPLFEEPQIFGLTDRVQGFMTESIGRPSFYEVSLK